MQPPKDLAKAGPGRALWAELTEAFDFDADPHRRAILAELCRTVDLCERLRKIVDEAPDLRVPGVRSGTQISLPELSELRQYRTLTANLVKSLALPDTELMAADKKRALSLVRSAARKGESNGRRATL
jgi:hypothetical protein